MDDSLCERFFCEPAEDRQRRYEALRAYFVEHRPVDEIARRFGYTPATVHSIVSRFRTQCRRGQAPPFS